MHLDAAYKAAFLLELWVIMESQTPVAPADRVGLGMQVHQAIDAKFLRLPARVLFGWLHLDNLELRIPSSQKLAAQEGIAPAKTYQRIRSEVVSAQLQMRQEHMNAYVAGCGAALSSLGVDELELRCCEDYVGLTARVRESALVADLSARLYFSSEGDQVRISCGQPRVYGHIDTPAPIIAHRLMRALFRVEDERYAGERGLADLMIRPLEAALFHCLPAAGWRLPRQSSLEISSLSVSPTGVTMRFRDEQDRTREAGELSRSGHAAASLAESLDQYRAPDLMLQHGDLEGAMRGYRGELAARGPEQPFLVERILSIASASREYFIDGLELARQVLGRWPDFAPAHAAIASIAVAQGDVESGASRYRELSQVSAAIGDEEGTVRAALAGARLLRQFAADDSTKLFELVLEHRPGHAESAEALADRYRDEERYADLVRLIRMRLATTDDAQRRARDHARLAEVLVQRLSAPELALAELVAACRPDESLPSVYEQRAEVELTLGNLDDALSSLESANSLHGLRKDLRARARNLIRGGQACIEAKKFGTAEAWFQAALEISLGNSQAMRGAAQAATGLGQYKEAARLWRELFEAGVEAPSVQAHFACELGRALLAEGNFTDAKAALERATSTGSPTTRAEARAALATMSIRDENAEEALDHLRMAIDELDCGDDEDGGNASAQRIRRGAELSFDRAQIAIFQGQQEDAMFDLRRAFDYAKPGDELRKDAARSLLQHTGSTEGELAWVEELAAGNPDGDERVYLALRRASILASGDDVEAALAVIASAESYDTLSDTPKRAALKLKAQLLATLGKSAARADVLAQRAALSGSHEQRAAASIESAQGWLEAGDLERCMTALRLGLQRLSESESVSAAALRQRALKLLAECAWKSRSWAEVEEANRALYGDDSTQAPPRSLLRWGTALEYMGQAKDAIEVLEGIGPVEEGELAAQIYLLQGHLYEQLDQVTLAAKAQEHYASNQSSELSFAAQADAWYRAGSLYRRDLKAIDDAKRCLAMALTITRDHLPALDALEQIAHDEGDNERLAVILSRKVATMHRHPKRQRGLLLRLAQLQEQVLNRSDVARETYRRILEMDPEYRPALRFAARDAAQSGNLPFARDALIRLSGALPTDEELSISEEELQAQRSEALFSLATVVEGTAGEANELAQELLLSEARAQNDDRLWRALESVYRRSQDLVGLADVLGRRTSHIDTEQALWVSLERLDILFHQLGDFGGALIALRIAQEHQPENEELNAWQERLDNYQPDAGGESAQATPPPPTVGALARALLDKGDWIGAGELLSPYYSIEDEAGLLWLHVEACLGLGEVKRAITLLPTLAEQAKRAKDKPAEHRAVRRLADLLIESDGTRSTARALYNRALQLDPDDLVAAELFAELTAETEQVSVVQSAREEVLEIARRTDAGPQQEALALIPLAEGYYRDGDFTQAIENYEAAITLAPTMLDIYRKCAGIAEQGELYGKAVQWLEALAAQRAAGVRDRSQQSESLGDLYLRIAELYYDKLSLPRRARDHMRLAADSFGPGMRATAVYRQIASEAASDGFFDEAIEAYEAIGLEELAGHERLAAAKLYQRVSRDHTAIELLESARTEGTLSDEGTRLLFNLHRALHGQGEFAHALEAGAKNAPVGIATTRLRESLRIFDNVLSDEETVLRIEAELDKRNPAWRGRRDSTESELEIAAESATSGGEHAISASLLARALDLYTSELIRDGESRDSRCRSLLAKLREIVTFADDKGVSTRETTNSLVSGLLSVYRCEESKDEAVAIMVEIAKLRHDNLHDIRGSADALGKALSIQAHNAQTLANLDAVLREAGDYQQLASAYEVHLRVITGSARSRPLIRLGRICHGVLDEVERARRCFIEAAESDSSVATEVRQLISQLGSESTPGFITDDEVTHEIDKAGAFEALGKTQRARAAFEATAVMAPQDSRAFTALLRIYKDDGDVAKLGRVLEQLTTLSNTPKERANLFFQRATLAREELHDDMRAYEFLKEAAANDPENLSYAHALRTMAMARGEWALAAELSYREISGLSSSEEKGALYFELGLIFDEKLLDPAQALINYEQALTLDPDIPAAPRPLARLYELANRHHDAMHMYKRAAAIARTEDESAVLLRHAAMNADQAGLADEAKELYARLTEVTTGTHKVRTAGTAVPKPAETKSAETKSAETKPAEAKPAEAKAFRDPVKILEDQLHAKDFQDDEEHAKLLVSLGEAYQSLRDDQAAALACYEQALQLEPKLVSATDALAGIAYEQRNWVRAHYLYRKVPTGMSKLDPGTHALRVAEIAEALGEEEGSFDAYTAALEFAPENTRVLARVARSAMRVGQLAEAFLAQQSLVELLPADEVERLHQARLDLANICEEMGDFDEAIRSYELILREEPDSVVALSRIPQLYMDADRSEDAIRALKAQLRVTPAPKQRADVLFNLGETYRLLSNDTELAADSYLKAVDLDPTHRGNLRRLLHYYCKIGDWESATEIAEELEALSALLETTTGLPLLHRAAIAAAICNNERLTDTLGRSLGPGSVAEIARALREAVQSDTPPDPAELARAARAVCRATGDRFAALLSLLEKSDDGPMTPLVAALRKIAR